MSTKPFILTTWSFGPVGNDAAFPALARGAEALDTVVHAATVIEDDPEIDSVGVGGLPDAEGEVSLDAAVMTNPDRCGAVCFMRHYPNPTQIARRVMEKTIHITLVGAGAEEFARREGFQRRELLTKASREVWEKWLKDPTNIDRDKYKGWLPPLNVEELKGIGDGSLARKGPAPGAEARRASRRRRGAVRRMSRRARPPSRSSAQASKPSSMSPLPPGSKSQAPSHPTTGGPHGSHDTVGLIALDTRGHLAAACSTSGMAFKVPSRVGDSPIIGHGLYCDQTAGAAVATGTGELISGVCGTFLVVELMRNGLSPQAAITKALVRIRDRYNLNAEHQVAFIASDAKGNWSSGALRPGFHHTITDEKGSRVEKPRVVLLEQ